LFKNLTAEKIHTLLSQIDYTIKKYKNNEVLFWEDTLCNQLSIVIKGSIRVESINYSGKVLIVRQISENEIFGEGLIFSDNNFYPVNVVSQKMNTEVLHIKKKDILKLFQLNQEISANLIRILSNKMTFLNQKVRLLALNTIRQKISLYLLEKYKENQSMKIPILTTKKNLADLFGIARPSLSRELMTMKSERIIDYDLNFFYIKDLEKLKNTLLK
jgi:CRP-like cAMP-binding protein